MGERGFRVLCIIMLVWEIIGMVSAFFALSQNGLSTVIGLLTGVICICAGAAGLRALKFGDKKGLCKTFGIIILAVTIVNTVSSVAMADKGSVAMTAMVAVLGFVFPVLYIAGAKNL